MSECLLLDVELEAALRAAGLGSASDLLALGGDGSERSFGGFVRLDVRGTRGDFYLKRYRYANWRASRGLIGRGTLWGCAPEVNEFRALRWLRDHDLPAVRPVAAASIKRRGRLEAHALLTEAVPDALPLDVRLATAGDSLRESVRLRRALAEDLGKILARMHELGFVHGDCHARNVLVRTRSDRARIWLLDCRRGGIRRTRRGPMFDLACLDHDLAGLASRSERRRALAHYFGSRGGVRTALRRIRALRRTLPPPRRPAIG